MNFCLCHKTSNPDDDAFLFRSGLQACQSLVVLLVVKNHNGMKLQMFLVMGFVSSRTWPLNGVGRW